ncbi:AraC family transcriptional regulator ligand-binding domain-containing protein [Phytobacter diazotrophicus]|uniref:AraC family transcriptional regulator n=1 Tax=Phytobacter diazotrophicus TaxID=395631 RepID=UPI0029369BB7|nr:AraC family transcriptional regulator ligand-binding domain-containing protein [Phytobacter diazotrophicus]MDV2902709.1 AraC family transcriptional regulator ligand-binding domain-containing protein [Phytobacter diazotrophicus]
MARNRTFSLDIGWKTLLKDAGLQPEQILRKAGLPDDLFSRPDRRLDTDHYFRFWRALEREANDAAFPLRLVEHVSAEIFDPPLFAALCSANMMQAVQRLARYKQLIAPMALETTVDQTGSLTVSPGWLFATDIPISLQVAELAFLLRLLRLATREPVKALSVAIPQRPEAVSARHYERFFGIAMQYGEKPYIRFSATDILRPFLTVNEGMWQVFEPELRRRLSQLDETASTAERVRAVLLELLPGNEATIEKTAERLGMSKRTLQRRLEEEGENFRVLINRCREKLARHYLSNTNLSGYEIAFLLGFEDPNSFYRAFMAWTGQTPETVRGSLRLN